MAYKIIENLLNNVRNYRNRELYNFIDETTGEWASTSWNGFLKKTEEIAMGLINAGVKPGDMVTVCSPNCPQMLCLDYALFMIRAVSVPISHLESQKVFDYEMNLTEAPVIFVGDGNQLEKALRYVKNNPDHKLRKIVVIWDKEDIRGLYGSMGESLSTLMKEGNTEANRATLLKRIEEGVPSDLAIVLFTTGTTGMPKGVMLGHEQLDAGIAMHNRFLGDSVKENQISLSYLPMSHVFEKAWLYMCIWRGLRIVFCYDTKKVFEIMHQVRPHIMCCVPRFWEKVYTHFFEYYNRQNRFRRLMIRRALYVGKKRNLYYRRTGRKVPSYVEWEYRFWDKRVFSRLTEQTGLSRPGVYPTAGSMLNEKIMGFFLTAGFDILLGYGLTETTASVTIFPFLNPVMGTVGRPLDGMEVRISDSGEVLVKGPTVMRGYLKAEEDTRAVFDEDGFFRTGDLGYIVPDGSLVINGRIKEIYKTSNGKIVPPLLIEKTLMESPLIERLIVVADQLKYVTALVYPNLVELRRIAAEHHWDYTDDRSLLQLDKTKELLMRDIEKHQDHLVCYMRVRDIAVMHRDLSKEAGEVGITGKIRRKVVKEHFPELVESLYAKDEITDSPLLDSEQPR